jgi:hypothetical protein
LEHRDEYIYIYIYIYTHTISQYMCMQVQ